MTTTKKLRKCERPDGLYQVSLELEREPDGSRKRKYFYAATRKEAESKRAAYRLMLKHNTAVDPDVTVAVWVQRYLSTYRVNVNPAYLHGDNVPYRKLTRALGAKPVRKVTEADLQGLLNTAAGTSFSNCEKLRQAIKRVFSKALSNGLIQTDPAKDLALPNHTKGTHRALEPWEIDAIRNHYSEHRAGLWVLLMLYAGLRRGEMIALDWSAVDLANRTLTIKQTAVVSHNQAIVEPRAKSAAGLRIVPICDILYHALCNVPETRRNGAVCVSALHGVRLSQTAVTRGLEAFNRFMERCTGKSFCIRYHDLRHTFCTILYNAGIDVKSAAYLMGHSDYRVTLGIYTHLTAEKQLSANRQLIAAIDAQNRNRDV